MDGPRALPGFDDAAPPDRYCDLILTGGVTSAVAYPGVIHGLAQAYRFNAIGGSSSGAGSAALAAAAEYRRRHGSSDGFRTLLARTAALADHYEGRTGLAWLFQPDAGSQRLFKVLLPVLAGPRQRLRRLLLGVVCNYKRAGSLGFVLGAAVPLALAFQVQAVEWPPWGLLAALTGLICAMLAVALNLGRELAWLADADYGMCSGQQGESGAAHPPLTAWLHSLIQDIAGLPSGQPLTFADLHAAPGGPRDTLGVIGPASAQSIKLQMFAASASLGRPQLLPQDAEEPDLFFNPCEMRALFPADVVDFMQQGAPHSADPELWLLPKQRLPVLVAARMSVSFPLLFKAVPLWQRVGGSTQFRRLLFVDGGLCSNFPVHLFDSFIPAWPTFGIALQKTERDATDDPASAADWVVMPQHHLEQVGDRWTDLQAQPRRPGARLARYAKALLSTTMDWNDALASELPGVRERIATIFLPANIGGFNILMRREQIRWLGHAGAAAARQLLQRYASPASGTTQAAGWLEHRWVRFNVLADSLQQSLIGLSRSAQFARYAEPLRQQIERAVVQAPLAGTPDSRLEPAEAAALERTLDVLLEVERALTPRPLPQPYRPSPRPELRIRHPM